MEIQKTEYNKYNKYENKSKLSDKNCFFKKK